MHFKLEEPSNKNMIDVSNKGYVCQTYDNPNYIWCICSILTLFVADTSISYSSIVASIKLSICRMLSLVSFVLFCSLLGL